MWQRTARQWAQRILGNTESIFGIFWCTKQSSGVRGSLGESIYENLELELTKTFNLNRRKIRVPEYSQGVKDPNTTQWQRGPIRHTAMLAKVLQCLDSTSAKECGRGIPTGSWL